MKITLHHTIESEIDSYDVTITAECAYQPYYPATREDPEEGGYFEVENMKVIRDDTKEDITDKVPQAYLDSFEKDATEAAIKHEQSGDDCDGDPL